MGRLTKQMLIIILAVLLAAGNISCKAAKTSSQKLTPQKVVIGVCFQGLNDEYIFRLKEAFESRAKQLGYVFLFSDGQMNAEIQNRQVGNYISQRVNCIVFNPISMEYNSPAVQACVKAKIPIIELISTTDNQNLCTSYVGSDSYSSGVIQAQMTISDLRGHGNVVILLGQMGHEAQINRYKGVMATLKNTNIHVIATQTGNWSRQDGYEIVADWLNAGKQFDAILSQNDAMAIGAITAIKEDGLTGKIDVYGVDAQQDALTMLSNGEMDGTVYQNAQSQGSLSAEVALDVALGRTVKKKYLIPYEPVRRDNVSTYQKAVE